MPQPFPRLACGLILASALIVAPGLGCSDDDMRAPPAAVSGGGSSRPVTSGRDDDAGGASDGPPEDGGASVLSPDAATDAPVFDVLPVECAAVDPTLIGSDQTVTQIAMPNDLVITRAETAWDGDCRDPVIRITLSAGSCPRGNGHELVFFIDESALSGSSVSDGIVVGQNQISPEPADTGIRVRYRRPSSAVDPRGEWGTCAGASGFVSFVRVPRAVRNEDIEAEFQLDLVPCDSDTEGTQQVIGELNVRLRRGIGEVCPPN